MEESELISEIEERQKELKEALVNGGNDLAADNKIRGEIIGLEAAKQIIHEVYIRQNNGDSESQDEF